MALPWYNTEGEAAPAVGGRTLGRTGLLPGSADVGPNNAAGRTVLGVVGDQATHSQGAGGHHVASRCFDDDSSLQRELRAGVLGLGALIGWDKRTVARFARRVSGKTWRRCVRADLERVLLAYLEIARCVRARVASDLFLPDDPLGRRHELETSAGSHAALAIGKS